jgi:hypothetical protein
MSRPFYVAYSLAARGAGDGFGGNGSGGGTGGIGVGPGGDGFSGMKLSLKNRFYCSGLP